MTNTFEKDSLLSLLLGEQDTIIMKDDWLSRITKIFLEFPTMLVSNPGYYENTDDVGVLGSKTSKYGFW